MYDEIGHWQWLAYGMGLLITFFMLYYCMIKSAIYWRYRLYQSDVTVPILDGSVSGKTTEQESNT